MFLLRCRSCRCSDTLALRLLLSYWSCRPLSLRRYCRTFYSLRCAWLNTWLMLDTARFTLWLNTLLRLNTLARLNSLLPFLPLRLDWSLDWSLDRSWSCLLLATSVPFVAYLELLSPRTIRRSVHAHRLRQIRTETWRLYRGAGYYSRIVEFSRDTRRNVDLSTTPS